MPSETFGRIDLPSGTIAVWPGTLSNVPSGWVLCDGNNGTPNLLDKFQKSVPDTSTDPGTTGGNHSQSLSNSQMASHNHNVSTGTDGDHGHTAWRSDADDVDRFTYGDKQVVLGSDGTKTSSSNGGHSHSISDNSTGGGGSFDNRPAYYEGAMVMKT